MPRGAPVTMMVSEKFREIAEKYKLKNILLVPGDSYYYDEREPLKWMEMIDFEGKGIWKIK